MTPIKGHLSCVGKPYTFSSARELQLARKPLPMIEILFAV